MIECLIAFKRTILVVVHQGLSRKHVYDEKNWLNLLCKYLGAALKDSKRIFDFYTF